MAYLTINIDGRPQEIDDAQVLYGGNGYYAREFVKELEKKINENKSIGKDPFDGIDFPDASKDDKVSWLLVDALNRSDTFVSALKTQPKNDELKSALTFVSNLDLSNQIEGCGVKDFDGRRKDLLLQTISDRYLDSEFMPLSCMMWKNAYKCQFDRNYGGGSCDFGYKEDIANRVNAGERLEGYSAQALRFIFKEGEGYRYFSSNDLKTISPLLENSDLSRLSEKDKQHIETLMNGSKLNDYVEKSLVTNLSQEALLKRKNITLEDLQTYYGRNIERSSAELYSFACKADRDNEAINKVRGELALKITNENIANGKYNDSNVRLDVNEEDLLRGYKDNPEALKALGVQIPSQIINVVKEDEYLKNYTQFIGGARNIYGDVGNHNFEEELNLLNQIAEKGFAAGYGAELTLLKMGKKLESNRASYESSKKNLEIRLLKKEKCLQVTECYNILTDIRNDAWQLSDFEAIGLTKDEVLKMAIDKTLGKEVKKMECTDMPTSGVKAIFMGKKAKTDEAAMIKAKQDECERVNAFVEKFSHKYRNYNNFGVVKYPENNPKVLLEQYSTIEEITKQTNDAFEYKETNKFDEFYFDEKRDREKVEQFEKLETVYKAAQEKIEYQANITRMAHETSGVKDMEANTGFDAMEVKAELLKENPELSVRELYAKVKEVRDRGEYTSEVKIKEPKSDKMSVPERNSAENTEQTEVVVEPKKEKTMEFRAESVIKADVLTASVEDVMKMVQTGQEKTSEAKQVEQEKKQESKVYWEIPKDFESKQDLINQIKEGKHKGPDFFKLPDNLTSKEPNIQKAIDLVSGKKFKNIEEMQTMEEYKTLPKYAQKCASMLCGQVATDSLNMYSTPKKIENFAKATIRAAEKEVRDKAINMRGLVKTSPKDVKKTSISKEMVVNKNLTR